MFERDNRVYYERRARQATELGDRATEPKVRALHYELALRFAILSVQGCQAKAEVIALRKGRKSAPTESLIATAGVIAKPEVESKAVRVSALKHG